MMEGSNLPTEFKLANLSPLRLLRSAIEAVPSLRYALGVGGLAAIVAIVLVGWKLEAQTAIFGTLVVLMFMVVLVIFSALAGLKSSALRPLALSLAWSFLIITLFVCGLFLACAFFDVPKTLPCLLRNDCRDSGHKPRVEGSNQSTAVQEKRISTAAEVGVLGNEFDCVRPAVRPIKFVATLGKMVGKLAAAGELHEFEVALYPGEHLAVEAVGLKNDKDISLCLESTASAGDKHSAKSGGGIARLSYKSAATGSMTLRIWEARGRIGSYRLSLRDLAAEPGASLAYGRHAFGFFRGNQDADVYQFEGKERDRVSLIVHDPDDSDGVAKPHVEFFQATDPKRPKLMDEGTESGTIALNEELPEDGIYKLLIQNKLGTPGSYFVCLENGRAGEVGRTKLTQHGGERSLVSNPLTLLSFIGPGLAQASSVYTAVITVGLKTNKDRPAFHVRDGDAVSISLPGQSAAIKIESSINDDKKGGSFIIYANSRQLDKFSLSTGEAREIKDGLVIELAAIIKPERSPYPSNSGAAKMSGRCCVNCGGTTSCGCAVSDSCGDCCVGDCCGV